MELGCHRRCSGMPVHLNLKYHLPHSPLYQRTPKTNLKWPRIHPLTRPTPSSENISPSSGMNSLQVTAHTIVDLTLCRLQVLTPLSLATNIVTVLICSLVVDPSIRESLWPSVFGLDIQWPQQAESKNNILRLFHHNHGLLPYTSSCSTRGS